MFNFALPLSIGLASGLVAGMIIEANLARCSAEDCIFYARLASNIGPSFGAFLGAAITLLGLYLLDRRKERRGRAARRHFLGSICLRIDRWVILVSFDPAVRDNNLAQSCLSFFGRHKKFLAEVQGHFNSLEAAFVLVCDDLSAKELNDLTSMMWDLETLTRLQTGDGVAQLRTGLQRITENSNALGPPLRINLPWKW
jgi:hypothetical protein